MDADVVIVGAGPAGTATAIVCREAGLSVLLLERVPFPRHRPGETLHPGVEPLLDRLGVGDAVRAACTVRHPGIWTSWGGSSASCLPFGEDEHGAWLGLQVPRERLDLDLLDRARSLGAQIRQPATVHSPVGAAGGLRGVRTGEGVVRARCVVDASGSWRWLERALGLGTDVRSPRLIARYGYTRDCPYPDDQLPCLEAGERSDWSWWAKVGEARYAWTALDLAAGSRARALGSPARGAEATWRLCRQPAGPGYFIVGDAAISLDPGSSHGVLRALLTGMQVGQLLVARGTQSTHMHRRYARWLAAWFEADVAHLSALYRQLPSPPAWLSSVDEALVSTPMRSEPASNLRTPRWAR